jgi:predicted N-formylglutamate amidohydrolase
MPPCASRCSRGRYSLPRPVSLVFSCEHGGNRVPAGYAWLFRDHEELLASHRGHDPGSLALARKLARELGAPLHSATVTRLLVDLNRSRHHRALFSELTRSLPEERKRCILRRYYEPYRRQVEQRIAGAVHSGCRVLHISVHSFAAELDGARRNADIGLLYDPARRWERSFATRLQSALGEQCPGWRTRRNYPYRGRADGFTTALRRKFPNVYYAGIELEVNQHRVEADAREWRRMQACLAAAIREAVGLGRSARGDETMRP